MAPYGEDWVQDQNLGNTCGFLMRARIPSLWSNGHWWHIDFLWQYTLGLSHYDWGWALSIMDVGILDQFTTPKLGLGSWDYDWGPAWENRSETGGGDIIGIEVSFGSWAFSLNVGYLP